MAGNLNRTAIKNIVCVILSKLLYLVNLAQVHIPT